MTDQSKAWVLKECKDKGVEFIRLWFTDILGIMKSFAITIEELEGALEEGMGFDGSSITGYQDIQESDMIAMPDPGTFTLLPWRPMEKRVAKMFCDVLTPDGKPYMGDPRYLLKRQIKKAADKGFTFYVGPELEYFYFKGSEGTEVLDHGGYFDLTPLDVATPLRRDTILYLKEMGIGVEYSHHEVAPSQHEIDLRYTDALTMADSAMTYRLVVKEVANEHGVYATFMPKPIFGQNGSGMHTHQSLFSGAKNAFFDGNDPTHLSRDGKCYIAGLLKHAKEMSCIIGAVGQLLQAACARFRGAGLHCVVSAQPLRPGPGAALQARKRAGDPRRASLPRPGLQPVSGIRGNAGRRTQRHRGRLPASRGDEREPLRAHRR